MNYNGNIFSKEQNQQLFSNHNSYSQHNYTTSTQQITSPSSPSTNQPIIISNQSVSLRQSRDSLNDFTINSSSTPIHSKEKIKSLLTFSTLNTQGLNVPIKLKNLINSVDNRAILCCTETKLKKDLILPNNYNGRSIIYGSSSSSKNGTAFIIGKDVKPHVFKILETSEYCLSVILKFKRKTNILFTVIYFPHDSKERKTASKLLHSTIRMARRNNLHHIITGILTHIPKIVLRFRHILPPPNNLFTIFSAAI